MRPSAGARFEARRDIPLLLLGIVVAGLVGEGALRAYLAIAPDPPRSVYIRDRDTGYRLRPGPFWEDGRDPDDRVNSLGFRDREHPVPRQSGTERVVGIGDSFVLGAVPIEKNFLRVAGTRLGADVAMMGLGGYGPAEYVGVLRSAGLAVDPDRVVLCFFVGNDITGTPLRGEVLAGDLYFTGSANRWTNLFRKSRLVALIERTYVTRVRAATLRKASGSPAPGSDAPSSFYLLVQKNRLPVYRRVPSAETERLWRRAEASLDEFDALCRRAEVPWTLMVIPSEIQVDPARRAVVLQMLGEDAAEYDFDGPQARLASFASARGIDLLDLLPRFRDASARGERLYIPNDTHWNVEGNRLAGMILAAYLGDGSTARNDPSRSPVSP